MNRSQMKKPGDNDHLWEQFCRLGERIGDGDLEGAEKTYVNREYKRLMLILCPDIKEEFKVRRQNRNYQVDAKMKVFLEDKKCHCGGTLTQSRSGSKILYCGNCETRYRVNSNKK